MTKKNSKATYNKSKFGRVYFGSRYRKQTIENLKIRLHQIEQELLQVPTSLTLLKQQAKIQRDLKKHQQKLEQLISEKSNENQYHN